MLPLPVYWLLEKFFLEKSRTLIRLSIYIFIYFIFVFFLSLSCPYWFHLWSYFFPRIHMLTLFVVVLLYIFSLVMHDRISIYRRTCCTILLHQYFRIYMLFGSSVSCYLLQRRCHLPSVYTSTRMWQPNSWHSTC